MIARRISKRLYLPIAYLYVFLKGDLLYFAASLSFYTIFAILPMLLIVFSVMTILPDFKEYLEGFKGFIVENFIPTYSDVFLSYLDNFLHSSTKLGGIGLIYAFTTSILFFRNYQFITQKIFCSQSRGFWDSLSLYWTSMTLIPLGILLSVYFSAKIYAYLGSLGYSDFLSWALRVIPYLVTWFVFFVLFKLSANTAISTKNILISSLITALFWSISKWAFVYYVFYNKAYLTLYGSFSIVLLLFIWIYLSWAILLFGMGLSKVMNETIEGLEEFKKKQA